MKRTTYLKLVKLTEAAKNFKLYNGTLVNTCSIILVKPTIWLTEGYIMVRCNSKGQINWDNTATYTVEDLIGKPIKFLK